MAQDNTLARSLHDLGLATWFGGSLMGAVGLNGAAAVVDQPAQRLGCPVFELWRRISACCATAWPSPGPH